ncbi:MAG: metal-dependent hydrolase [Balneolaceae bacterium]
MDSITHIVAGAAIGEAYLGHRTGYKGALWGAAICTLPDLDVLLNPILDSANQLVLHRGFTHSLFFAFAASPILGWLIYRWHKTEEPGWTAWAWLSFWSLLSHVGIDLTTSYGTQILEPFSRATLTTDTMFIIDPFFTFPLIAGLVITLFQRRSNWLQPWPNRIGLTLGALYLIWGFGVKAHVDRVFEDSFHDQYGSFERVKTMPGPFSTVMWKGYVERNDSLYASTYSLFDKDEHLQFQGLAKQSHLLDPFLGDRPVDVLKWFTMGYYMMEEREDGLYLHDIRFGRSDFWLSEQGNYIWSNRLLFNEDSTQVVDFDRAIPILNANIDSRRALWERFWGEQ